MAAVQRRRKAYSQRRSQKRSGKILSRQRGLHSRRNKKATTRRLVKYARSHHPKRRQSISRDLDRRMRANVLSAHKAKHTMCSQRSKGYSRKPSQTHSGLLHTKLKKKAAIKAKLKKALKEQARHTGLKKAPRKPRQMEDDIFYRLAKPPLPKVPSPSKETQPKNQPVRFTTRGNKNQKMEGKEDQSTGNQCKKRGRHVCQSR